MCIISDDINLTIDGQAISVPPGTTLLEAAAQLGLDVPTICYHPNLTANAICRMCVVEVEGARVLPAACVAECGQDMKVTTRNERVERSRRTILEMLGSAVDLSEAPEIEVMQAGYAADASRFAGGATRHFDLKDDNPFYVRDYSQCVMCWRCVQVCAEDSQYTFALSFGERGFESHIATFFDAAMPESTCVYCGQCVGVCPTGALKAKREWGLEQGLAPEEIWQQTRAPRKRKNDDK